MASGAAPDGRIVRVLPDVAAIDKSFDYLVPEEMSSAVRPGTRVRVPLGRRRVDGWVLDEEPQIPPGVTPLPILRAKGAGPPRELLALARWAAWRWAGRAQTFLATASPPVVVRDLPAFHRGLLPAGGAKDEVATDALAAGSAVVRLAPGADYLALVEAACSRLSVGVLVLAPSRADAAKLASRLRRGGWPVAHMPGEWAAAAAGGRVVVGTRSAAWAPPGRLDAVVVLDAHDEAYQEERAPTWRAWLVAAERARRSGSPCILVSPCPTLEMLGWGRLVCSSRRAEREGWAALEVIDRRRDDPRSGLLSSRLVPVLRSATAERRVVCVLNRKGRARLVACAECAELARCERCDGPVGQVGSAEVLRCRRCEQERPPVCAHCGSRRLRVLRPGVARLKEELEALSGRPVEEVTAESGAGAPSAPLLVGTEAVLHRVEAAAVVAFLDMDAELLLPTYSANERAMALLCRAARVVGGRQGRVIVQTRMPGHEVIAAGLHADPGRLAAADAATRRELRLPPFAALARVSGSAAAKFVESLAGGALEVMGPHDGSWLLRATSHAELCGSLAAVERPSGRVRIEVDPRKV